MTELAGLFFNPLQDGYGPDPYPHFAEMRDGDPIHLSLLDQWVLFRYDDVSRLLRDPTLSVEDDNIEVRNQERLATVLDAYADQEPVRSMLGLDDPDHARLRRLVSKAFTPSAIAGLRPMIERRVTDALDAMEERGTAEVVGELAWPLPFDVISEMLGLPEADTEQIAKWSAAIVKTIDPIITDEEIYAAAAAGKSMRSLLAEIIEWKRANPADDILSALIEAEEDGDRLTPKELRAQVQLLFIAGHETTVNLIGTGIYELLRNPEQAEELRDDPTLDVAAVDELLRHVSPVQFSRRITLSDIEFDGITIPAGMSVLAGLASSNHDPRKWGDDADRLDLRRPGAGQHLAFGSGSHYCLGASLAKLEAQVAIPGFIRRFPNAAVVGEPEWNGRINLRGLERLHVTL